VTFPNQYVYNSAFHLKMLCLLLAGANVAFFYVAIFRRLGDGVPGPPPMLARLSGAISLGLWITVIVCGRMITFFRPAICGPDGPLAFVANCIVR
jgi:hypothetical protein